MKAGLCLAQCKVHATILDAACCRGASVVFRRVDGVGGRLPPYACLPATRRRGVATTGRHRRGAPDRRRRAVITETQGRPPP